jgi:hypothetical protein
MPPRKPSATRFTVQRRSDGKWAVIDRESRDGILVFYSDREEAHAMLEALTSEIAAGECPEGA